MNFGQELPPPGTWNADGTRLSNGDGRGEEPPSLVSLARSDNTCDAVDALSSSMSPLSSPVEEEVSRDAARGLLLILNSTDTCSSAAGMESSAVANTVSSSFKTEEKDAAFSRDAGLANSKASASVPATT